MAKKVNSSKSQVKTSKLGKTVKPRLAGIEEQAHYEKIGRLRKPIADAIKRKAADIYISENHLKHILLQHGTELAMVGLTPKIFVDLVVMGYNRIYKGTENSLILVIYSENSKVVAIDMNYAFKKGFYEVKTATVMREKSLEKKELLWTKK